MELVIASQINDGTKPNAKCEKYLRTSSNPDLQQKKNLIKMRFRKVKIQRV